jgi:hypothetical protein
MFQKICWEEPEKQKTRSPPGAGIIPKQCPMERVETKKWIETEYLGEAEVD